MQAKISSSSWTGIRASVRLDGRRRIAGRDLVEQTGEGVRLERIAARQQVEADDPQRIDVGGASARCG